MVGTAFIYMHHATMKLPSHSCNLKMASSVISSRILCHKNPLLPLQIVRLQSSLKTSCYSNSLTTLSKTKLQTENKSKSSTSRRLSLHKIMPFHFWSAFSFSQSDAASKSGRRDSASDSDLALASQSANFGREEIRNYYRMVDDENQKSYWTPMDLCGRIGARGKKMMLAAFVADNRYTASQIATAFTNHHFSHLTFALGGAFKCNANDVQKSVTYLESIGYEWHLRYNAKNKAEWENSAEAWREVMHWVKELEKGIPEGELVRD